jgi:hypothetical protein
VEKVSDQRTIGPRKFLSTQKIFPPRKKEIVERKGKIVKENSHHDLRNAIISASIFIV